MKTFYFPGRTALKTSLALLFKSEGTKFTSLTYIFCSDDYLLGINNQFLHHNYYTDIITFNLADENKPVEGEIYVSIDRVKDNARQMQQKFQHELSRVIFHGALHLCGYGDASPGEKQLMREREDFYLNKFHI